MRSWNISIFPQTLLYQNMTSAEIVSNGPSFKISFVQRSYVMFVINFSRSQTTYHEKNDGYVREINQFPPGSTATAVPKYDHPLREIEHGKNWRILTPPSGPLQRYIFYSFSLYMSFFLSVPLSVSLQREYMYYLCLSLRSWSLSVTRRLST